FKRWSDALAHGIGSGDQSALAAASRAYAELATFFTGVIAKRRAAPRTDLIGALLAAQAAGGQLNDEELGSMLILLLAAGNVTTTDLIGNGMLALLGHPHQLAALRADLGLLPNAVEEMLRYDTPVLAAGRIAAEDTTLEGCPLRSRQSLIVS